MKAKLDIDLLYGTRMSWNDLPIDQKVARYKEMKNLLEICQILIPDSEESFAADIASKIKECNLHIPLLSIFYEKLAQGNLSFSEGHRDNEKHFFSEALEMIRYSSGPDYLLARALGTMGLSFTHLPLVSFDRQSPLLYDALAAYNKREELFTNEKTKVEALSLFHKLWNGLSQLVPTDLPVYSEIMEKLADCQRQLASLPQAGNPDSKKTSPGRKVTPVPVNDSRKTVKIFVAFSIAAAIIVGAAVLGRRFFTRLN